MTVTAHIDISTPAGRKILEELKKHSKVVKIDYQEADEIADVVCEDDMVDIQVAEDRLWTELEKKFGQDIRNYTE
jgi:hypothetical protein